MNFTRMKKRGMVSREQRAWFDDTRTYRVTWRRVAFGVEMIPGFFACVKVRSFNGGTRWEFADKRRLFKTQKAAIEACERNEAAWKAVIELGDASGRRLDRVRALQAKYKEPLDSVPLWAEASLDPVLMNLLFPKGRATVEDDEECDQDQFPAPSIPLKSTEPTSVESPAASPKSSKRSSRKGSGRASTAVVSDSSGTETAKPKSAKRAKAATPAQPKSGGKSTRKPKNSTKCESKSGSRTKKRTAQPSAS